MIADSARVPAARPERSTAISCMPLRSVATCAPSTLSSPFTRSPSASVTSTRNIVRSAPGSLPASVTSGGVSSGRLPAAVVNCQFASTCFCRLDSFGPSGGMSPMPSVRAAMNSAMLRAPFLPPTILEDVETEGLGRVVARRLAVAADAVGGEDWPHVGDPRRLVDGRRRAAEGQRGGGQDGE